MEYQAHEIILLFFIYAFLGWCCEVAFAACKQGKFINRGFLNGPICPIYGFGVIGVAVALYPVRDNLLMLYLGAVVLTTLIEFVTGYMLERIFHARWWDYSNMPMNIMGYVCLLFSMIWGLACLVIVRWLHPWIVAAVQWLPPVVCIILDCLFVLIFIVDLCATVSAARKLSERLVRLTELGQELHAISDEIGQTISDRTLAARQYVRDGEENFNGQKARIQQQFELKEAQISHWLEQQRVQKNERTEEIRTRFEQVRLRLSQTLEEKNFVQRRLLKAFPNLRSQDRQEALDALRAFIDKRRNKK